MPGASHATARNGGHGLRLLNAINGAHDQNRTGDPFLTMEVLYRLSYAGLRSLSITTNTVYKMERETRLELATLSLEG